MKAERPAKVFLAIASDGTEFVRRESWQHSFQGLAEWAGIRGSIGGYSQRISGYGRRTRECLMTTHKVGYLIGSLAKGSINRKLAKALVQLTPPELEMSEIAFKDLPLYSYDYDTDFPPLARAFKDAIAAVEAVLFVTPEYNRSIPGGLKNAIDWASRPYGKNSFARKPSAVIGTSPGAIGTAVAQQSLRSVLSFCNSPQMNAPEAYIQFTPGLITDNGEVTVESTEEFLRNYMQEFHSFIARVLQVLPKDA